MHTHLPIESGAVPAASAEGAARGSAYPPEMRERAIRALRHAQERVGTASKAAIGRLTAERFPEFSATQVRGWLNGLRPKVLYLYDLTQQTRKVAWSSSVGTSRAFVLGAILSTHVKEGEREISGDTPMTVAAPGNGDAEDRLAREIRVLLRRDDASLWKGSGNERRARIFSSVLQEHVMRTTGFRQHAPWGVLTSQQDRISFLQGLFQFSSLHIDYTTSEARIHFGRRTALANDTCLLLRSVGIDASVVGGTLTRVHVHGADSLREAAALSLCRLTQSFVKRQKPSHRAEDVEFVLAASRDGMASGSPVGPRALRRMLSQKYGSETGVPTELTIGRWLKRESIPAAFRRKQAAQELLAASEREIARLQLRERELPFAPLLSAVAEPSVLAARLIEACGYAEVASAALGIPPSRIHEWQRGAELTSAERLRLAEVATFTLYEEEPAPPLYVQVGQNALISPEDFEQAANGVRRILTAKFNLGGETEDIVQQAVTNVLRSQTFDPEKGTIAGYLWGAARHLALDHLRRVRSVDGRRVVRLEDAGRFDEDAEFSVAGRGVDYREPEDILASEEQVTATLESVSALSPHLRTVLELRYLDELSYADIAARLEIPIGTVMSRLFTARRRLGELLQLEDCPA